MLKSFEVTSSIGRYEVNIGDNLLSEKLNPSKGDVCIVDACLTHFVPNEDFIIIPIIANEQNKSLDALCPIIKLMRQNGADRTSKIFAVGGGVIQDIATIVASLYMRGIPWEYLPTTLLGMVDSCIGGKSSINVDGYKNLIGNIYPPKRINIDVKFLDTLGEEQIIDGLCEAVKICYAKSIEELDHFLQFGSNVEASLINIRDIIVQCLKAKQWFIEVDEFDRKERLLLNFGHTFGHALESACDFRISHGIGVGIGMIVAEEYALQQTLLSSTGVERTTRLTTYLGALIKRLPQVAGQLKNLAPHSIMEMFENDKKHLSGQYRIIVPQGDGGLALLGIPKTPQSCFNISSAYAAAIDRITNFNCTNNR